MRKWIIVFVVAIVLSVVATAQAEMTQAYGPFDVTFYNNGDSDGYYTGARTGQPSKWQTSAPLWGHGLR